MPLSRNRSRAEVEASHKRHRHDEPHLNMMAQPTAYVKSPSIRAYEKPVHPTVHYYYQRTRKISKYSPKKTEATSE